VLDRVRRVLGRDDARPAAARDQRGALRKDAAADRRGGGAGRAVRGLSPHRRPARRRGDPGARRRRLAAAPVRSGRVGRRRGDAILGRRGDALSRAGGPMKPGVVDEAKAKAREYFRTRGTLATAASIRERVADAFGTLQAFLEPISAATAARVGIPGEWTI